VHQALDTNTSLSQQPTSVWGHYNGVTRIAEQTRKPRVSEQWTLSNLDNNVTIHLYSEEFHHATFPFEQRLEALFENSS